MKLSIPLAPLLLCGYLLAMLPAQADDWRTKAEVTDYRETPRYDETMAYCRRLAAASEFVHLETLGRSPEGRDIRAVIVSLDHAFTPEAARATGKEIVLVNCCIHPGESEGKDASLALLRDLLINGEGTRPGALLAHVILIVVPIHGVDGHERFGPYNRINQNGPAEMGWRTSAQNNNLNRDWLKADAPEMRAELDLFHRWLPDLLIDTHTTDGAELPVRPDLFTGKIRQPGSGGRRVAKGGVRRPHLSRADQAGSQDRALHHPQQPAGAECGL